MIDLSKVPDIEKRESARLIIERIRKAVTARKAASESARAARDAESNRLTIEYEARLRPLREAVAVAEAPHTTDIEAFTREAEALGAVLIVPSFSDPEFVTCAVSGLPIFEDDAVWEDGEYFACKALQCLLPPVHKPALDDGEGNGDDAAEMEDAA